MTVRRAFGWAVPALLVASGGLLVAGCGGGGDDDPATISATPEQEDAYIAAITPSFGGGEVDRDRWLANARITCRFSDRTLAKRYVEAIDVGRVRLEAAVHHICPDRVAVIENPQAHLSTTTS